MPLSKSLNHIPYSSVKAVDEDRPVKQGIVAILRSDCERTKAASIRRTLSADMSSKKWLQQNGFFAPIKNVASSEELATHPTADSSSSESEEEYEKIPRQDDVLRSVQKGVNDTQKPAPPLDVWSSILSTQKSDTSSLPPPYVHHLVKRSSSALTEKSLEVCTESLGSETGSDGFSSYPPSDSDEEKEDRRRIVQEELKETDPFGDDYLHIAKYKKSPARPSPPPLPSIAGGCGASLHVRSRRENGRLVLEAVSVPPRSYFQAQRRDGRLVLTMIHSPSANSQMAEEKSKVAGFEEVFDDMEGVGEEIQEEEEDGRCGRGDDGYEEDVETEEGAEELSSEDKRMVKEEELLVQQGVRSLPNGMVSVHKSAVMTKKFMAIRNKNLNKVDDAAEEEEIPFPQSLPPPPRGALMIPPRPPPAAASFNAYEYLWRKKTAACGGGGGFINPTIASVHLKNKHPSDSSGKIDGTNGYERQDFGPYWRGCKEGRRSLLIWEPPTTVFKLIST